MKNKQYLLFKDFSTIIYIKATTILSLIKTSYNKSLIHPETISGLVQSDGSFTISIVKASSKLGFVLRPSFSIRLLPSSYPIIKAMKDYFGVGEIYITQKYVNYQVNNFMHLWHVIIPHFIKYPLHSRKHISFVKFVTIMRLLLPYQNKIKPDLVIMKILVLLIDMNAGSARNVDKIKYWLGKLSVKPVYNFTLLTDYLKPLLNISSYFLVGVIEGDGSFYFTVRNNNNIRFGFNISTNIEDIGLLYAIMGYLKVGYVQNFGTWARFNIENNKVIENVMIPLVDNVGMLSSKRAKYQRFRKVFFMYKNKDHLTENGMNEIKELVREMKKLK